MPGYMKDPLHKFQHPTPTRPQHSPHQWTSPQYVSIAPQMAHPANDSPALHPDEENTFQQVVGFLRLCTRSLPDNASHNEHNCSSTIKKHPGKSEKVVQIINYAGTYPETITRYNASVMPLHMHSDA